MNDKWNIWDYEKEAANNAKEWYSIQNIKQKHYKQILVGQRGIAQRNVLERKTRNSIDTCIKEITGKDVFLDWMHKI